MKKTIAILLVMTMALVGVFATTAAMQVTTVVAEKANVKLTAYSTTGLLTATSTLAAFDALTALGATAPVTVGKTAVDVYTPVANLNFFSNQTAAFTTTFTAKSMYVTGTSTSTSRIDYTVKVGDTSPVSLLSTDAGTAASSSIELKGVTTAGSVAGTLPIAVKVVDADWDAAAQGTYVGDITFTFTAV
ncbi:hypothetical protein [uncultured Sphaerochaeta sp.]|uniref:hypothetical protein n=1 Tax=uncultured Sphaerochaeta sp. TaxID=886478 RepID=UPI002A0A67D3|nr:hypothetical protein [uncultured Sphaerochaeta sp.]